MSCTNCVGRKSLTLMRQTQIELEYDETVNAYTGMVDSEEDEVVCGECGDVIEFEDQLNINLSLEEDKLKMMEIGVATGLILSKFSKDVSLQDAQKIAEWLYKLYRKDYVPEEMRSRLYKMLDLIDLS